MTFWFIAILLIILLPGGLIYLVYWITKRYRKTNLRIWLLAILTALVLAPMLSLVLEDYLFFQSDAIEYLNEHQITLQDDFELVSNEMLGITDLYHQFELEISPTDKAKFIDFILKSDHYQDSVPDQFDLRTGKPRYSDKAMAFKIAYQTEGFYVYEYYKPHQRGYAPVWDRISLSKAGHRLTYQRFED